MYWRAGNGSHGTSPLAQSLPTNCRPRLHLHESFLHKSAPFARNFVALSRATVNSTPAFGDELRVKDSELLLHFYPVRELPAVIPAASRETHVAPFIEAAAIESAATARRDDAKVFLREFTRELVREINPSTKLVTLAIAIVLVGDNDAIGPALDAEALGPVSVVSDDEA